MNKKLAAEHIDFADSRFESFHMNDRENILKVYLTSWQENELIIDFLNPVHFSYSIGESPSELYEMLGPSEFLNEALALQCIDPLPPHSFKHFQLWDLNDFHFINIVAESVTVTKGKESSLFRS